MLASYNEVGVSPMSSLLRRIERLERKVNDLEIKNEKLEKIVNSSFVGFKFNKEDIPNDSNHEITDEMRRTRLLSQILSRK